MPPKKSGLMDKFKHYNAVARNTGRVVVNAPANLVKTVQNIVKGQLAKYSLVINNLVETLSVFETKLDEVIEVVEGILELNEPAETEEVIE